MPPSEAELEPTGGPSPAHRITLVLGGARSGKSRFAEALLDRAAQPVYVATAEAADAEMAQRIHEHQARRGLRWRTLEVPLGLTQTLIEHANHPEAAILVDCLTLWLSNLMGAGRDVSGEVEALAKTLPALSGEIIFVSNEVGLGIVPENPLARRFRDCAGRLHQALAGHAERVFLLVAGIPMVVRDRGIDRPIDTAEASLS